MYEEFKWGDKSALHLYKQTASNPYEESIVKGANAMVDAGHVKARYETQYASGTTCWALPDGRTLMVDKDGFIV
jgi:hypothetical protein